jgi:hypothetical protein
MGGIRISHNTKPDRQTASHNFRRPRVLIFYNINTLYSDIFGTLIF